ncbi:conserved hypothetical protein [Histoplasma capsulatum G186AR]|uniref:Cation diffusion facilitator family metal ion transporter n=1 Tax=Ajellomyces capsulatus (strain G186AR / H82 / ATCC MYA-2454 / RMSCC 2432) TaxID=447093 RepID=C0NGJ3_AJECG|nr:uncharacterized protein HCBG_02465 [Histoplasma capsulatum G186AR]EEH08928.1 conserved hypothetical protein [Histoplasma capsulatum G186AR]
MAHSPTPYRDENIVSENPDTTPSYLTFGWQRSTLLGAFFNGVFLLALGVSIILQSIERFVSLERVEKPELMLIIGCVGLTLNLISASFLHEHGHDHHHHNHNHGARDVDQEQEQNTTSIQLENRENAHENHRHANNSQSVQRLHDLGVMGVLLHVIGDAINNIGVIIAALIIWKATHDGRYYADPGVSTAIGILILASAIPLGTKGTHQIPGVISVHELHAWRLNQNKAIATAHVVTSDTSLAGFMARAQCIGECLHAYGIHSITLQPELASSPGTSASVTGSLEEDTAVARGVCMRRRRRGSTLVVARGDEEMEKVKWINGEMFGKGEGGSLKCWYGV